ncbi:hypothetical protein [Mycetocola miduiensis]|uniref:Uncharacterized protein n=1 Tax=Mycetocola miduiensis TaxID=995034 RepID=A0A1I5AEG7_9MICO|nr:hypothetical protein [Mycetocola miduiensis]SFN60827.1 hypothetical protein SAMN05216219_1393 [Mycetocola miduiensis]
MAQPVSLNIDSVASRPVVVVRRGDDVVELTTPVIVTVLDHEPARSGYDTVDDDNGSVRGQAHVELVDGTVVSVTDLLSVADDNAVRLDRRVTVVALGSGSGLQVRLEGVSRTTGTTESEWQYYLPCTLYNRNDGDGDGVEDYLGSYTQDLRDDKNGALAALARSPKTGTAFSIARTTVPTFDTAISADDLRARSFVQSTDIGSLGLAPGSDGSVTLRASYPFAEERSFSLDTAGTGWEAYAPLTADLEMNLSYEFRIEVGTPDLTEAIWALFEHQRQQLGTQRPSPDVSLDESVEYRQLLTQLNYRKWSKDENEKEPAGYLVHFSPRSGEVRGSLIEFGFSGDQTLVAWAQLAYGYRTNVRLYQDRARSVIDFFVRHCQLENGFSQGIYDPIHDRFTYWFTGILMPFQYAEDEEDVRRFVGRQMAEALMPIARELREVEGNYMRTMCESFYPILLAYELDAANGRTNDEWLTTGRRFGEFLLDAQAEDGSWFRAYEPSGDGLTSPGAWFGKSYVEQKSGTIFPVPVLTMLHRLTGDERYLTAAEKAADFIIQNYVEPTVYMGGLNDTTHIKSVKTDAVGVMFLMRSLLKAYEATSRRPYLDAAVKSAKILSSWVYLWDVPMPEGTLLAEAGFKSTGWAGCDVIASGSYLDDEFLEFTADLVRIAELAGEPALFDIAELVEYGMQYGVSTPTNDHGYVAPGIQCEGILTSYWVSAPDTTEFSGAVNKVKGDDNDTCNALTNAQAAYGIYSLVDAYGTSDFSELRNQIFQHERVNK